MNKRFKYAIWFFVAALVLLLVFNIFRYLNKNLSYALATKATVEQLFTGEATLIRNEKTISVSGGVFEAAVTPGTRVSGKSLIGYLYKGTLDTETEKKLRDLNEQIAQLSASSLFNDAHRSTLPEEVALDEAHAMMEAINAGDYNRISSHAMGIELALNQQKEEGEKTDFDQQLLQLQAEKVKIEERISAVRENVHAPFGGIFSENIDGYEDVFSISGLKKLTSNQLKETRPVKDSGEFVKIVDNSEWFLAMNIPAKEANGMYVGMPVRIRLPELDEEAVQAEVYALNQDDSEVCLVLSCSQTISGVFDYRNAEVEVVTSSKSGFQIPAEALRMHEDQQGVYVVRDNLARFVPIEIVLQEEDFMLVSTTTSGGVRLYDEVITNGNVEEGMLIQ